MIDFQERGWNEYLSWQVQDKKILKKINDLIKDIARNGNTGIGHPEPLKDNLTGWWSRHIDDKNRLVYRINDDGKIVIAQCKGHYSSN